MDRGRAGGYITDNNYFGIQVKRKQREDHLRRLEKIKHRKPGTSSTLDNSAPNVAKSIAEDPRKASQSHSFNYITEKENRSLLKRISLILTAPPKITDKDYQEMKKLCKSAKDDPRSKFEKSLQDKQMVTFFQQVKRTGAYYSAKRWEEDYQHQRYNQRFMRQVKYTRPAGFVDPFAPAEQVGENPSSSPSPTAPLPAAKLQPIQHRLSRVSTISAAHVHRIRQVRQTHLEAQQEHPVPQQQQQQRAGSPPHTASTSSSYEADYFYNEDRSELASIDRLIKYLQSPQPTEEEETPFLPARITCYLLPSGGMVITVEATTGGSTPRANGNSHHAPAHSHGPSSAQVITAEAEISLSDLLIIGDYAPHITLTEDLLKELAVEIIDNVELHQEGESVRLLLSLVNELDESDESTVDMPDIIPTSEEEVANLLLPIPNPTVLCTGMRLKVTFQLLSVATGVTSLGGMLGGVGRIHQANKPEHLYTLIRVVASDDALTINAFVVNSSEHFFKKGNRSRPAIPSGTMLSLTTPIPSLLQADGENIISFAENLLQNVKIEHDCKTGENSLVIVTVT